MSFVEEILLDIHKDGESNVYDIPAEEYFRGSKSKKFSCSLLRLKGYYSFIYERQNIWHKRFVQKLPRPWTSNQILNDWKFTNVYRELDKGTIYLLEWLHSESPKTHEDILFNILLYRFFNNEEAHAECGGFVPYKEFNITVWEAKMRARRERGDLVFSDSFMTNSYGRIPGVDKLARMANMTHWMWQKTPLILAKWKTHIPSTYGLRFLFEDLTKLDGIGDFNSYEIITDLTYTEVIPYTEDNWANAGPGASYGLEFIFGSVPPMRATKLSPVTRFDLILWLRNNQEHFFDELRTHGHDFKRIAYLGKPLTTRNIEHCLCEYHKYQKTLIGKGRLTGGRFVEVSKSVEDLIKLENGIINRKDK